ncbi:MAG: hypothetical protein KKE23_03845 [Nanoarchaeota archaeon]|nr:hypothetical protein [Nanoarchaeota archaeon]
MKKIWIVPLALISIFLVSGISGCAPENEVQLNNGTVTGAEPLSMVGEPPSGRPCWAVYKTNRDYFDLQFIYNFNKTKPSEYLSGRIPGIDFPSIGIHIGGSNPLYKLNQGYVGYMQGSCSLPSSFAFTNISISKWKGELEECVMPLKEYEESLVLKNCNDEKFLWRITAFQTPVAVNMGEEPAPVAEWGGQMMAAAQTGGGDCSFILSNEEKSEFTQKQQNWEECRTRVSEKYNGEFSIKSIIDEHPFKEFYVCSIGVDELNSTIDNGELSTKCKRKI